MIYVKELMVFFGTYHKKSALKDAYNLPIFNSA